MRTTLLQRRSTKVHKVPQRSQGPVDNMRTLFPEEFRRIRAGAVGRIMRTLFLSVPP
jgi:hypothetical protein